MRSLLRSGRLVPAVYLDRLLFSPASPKGSVRQVLEGTSGVAQYEQDSP